MATINAINNASAPFGCTGDLTITTGNLLLPTTSSTVGQIQINAAAVFHTYGVNSLFVGQGAGNFTFGTTKAQKNTAVGYNALNAITGGGATASDGRNVAIGYNALATLNASTNDGLGMSNVVIGADALASYPNSTGSVCIGDNAGYKTNSYNVYVGFEAGKGGGNGNISNNVAIGYQALKQPTTNTGGNVCVGTQAGLGGNVYQTNYNVVVGYQAGYQMSLSGSTSDLILIGYRAGYNYTGAQPETDNICIGHNVVGTVNETNTLRIGVATGTSSGNLKTAYISGIYTTAATPSGTAKVTLTDSANVVYGLTNTASALLCVAAGGTVPTWSTGPTITGTMSAASFATTTAATIMTLNGKTITMSGSDTDVSLVVVPKGAGTITCAAIYSNVVIGSAVLVDSSGNLGVATSSRRYKESIEDMAEQSSSVMKLRPVTFAFKDKSQLGKQYGLIAEEVEEVFPSLVNYNKEGMPESVRYHDLPAILLNEIQKMERRIRELETRLDAKEIQ